VPSSLPCPGHSVAAGGLLLLTADLRIGIIGDFKIGLNEVAIGLPLPVLGLELAKDRLAPNALGPATLGAQLYDPEGACRAGYLDEAVPEARFAETVRERARTYGDLDPAAFAETKRRLRSATLERMVG
jgi:enoyl-CoA hydratase